jgi:GNAT superfamily N-acetyltransferase
MIVKAEDFDSRYAALKFVTSFEPYTRIPTQRREELALIFALTAPNFFAIEEQDACERPRRRVHEGPCEAAPIFYYKADGRIVGVVVCSTPIDGLPLRAQMGAVHPAWRGKGIASEMLAHVIALAPVVGVAPGVPGMDEWCRERGFTHWFDGQVGPVGFTAPPPAINGLLYAVPAALDFEIEAARLQVQNSESVNYQAGH